MAIVKTDLTSGQEGGGSAGASSTTASISPGDDRLVLCAVRQAVNGSSPNPGAPSSLSGGGMTAWTLVANQSYRLAGSPISNLSLWRALEASPGTGALTINGNSSTYARGWAISEFANVKTGGVNGEDAIVASNIQVVIDDTFDNTLTDTLNAFDKTENRAFICAAHAHTTTTLTPEAAYSEIYETANSLGTLMTAWRDNDTPDLTPFVSLGASTFKAMISIELAEAIAAGGIVVPRLHPDVQRRLRM